MRNTKIKNLNETGIPLGKIVGNGLESESLFFKTLSNLKMTNPIKG